MIEIRLNNRRLIKALRRAEKQEPFKRPRFPQSKFIPCYECLEASQPIPASQHDYTKHGLALSSVLVCHIHPADLETLMSRLIEDGSPEAFGLFSIIMEKIPNE